VPCFAAQSTAAKQGFDTHKCYLYILPGSLGEVNHLERFQLHLDAWGRLVLTETAGRQHLGVEAVRGFPISSPRHGISLIDSSGRELVWVESLDDLPEATRRLLEEELPRRELIPQLQRVVRVSGVSEPTEWDVETDRGATRFILNSEDDVRRLGEGRALLVDANGIRYLIPQLETLDPFSRRVLERYL